MIGVFDSGHGGLTVFRGLVQRFPGHSFVYGQENGAAIIASAGWNASVVTASILPATCSGFTGNE